MSPQYPELHTDRARILEIAVGEESAFLQTLKSGTLIFDSAAGATKKSGAKSLSGSDAFKLHDTYGFPYDLTLEMASEQGLTVDEDAFRKLMKEQRDRAKADARAKKSGHADLSIYRAALDQSGTTEFTGYTQTKSESKIKYLLVDGAPVAAAKAGDEVEIMLDRTPFYAEGGGQLSDTGFIRTANGALIEIDDVQTPVPNLFLHRGKVVSGEALVNESGFAEIDIDRRAGISRAHTATHMVHKAFREALGETATQAGSENSPGRFRFDFSAVGAVSGATMSEVEDRVNSLLVTDLEITAEVMSQDEAKAVGAMALFGEKYGSEVRVVSVGDWAKELCGGTHVSRSSQLGVIKLLGESSIGAGVRRVEALVGVDAYRFYAKEHAILNLVGDMVKSTRSEELPERISALLERVKSIEREISGAKSKDALNLVKPLADKAEQIGNNKVVLAQLSDGVSGDDLRTVSLEIRNLLGAGAVVALISNNEDKPVLVVACDESARKSGLKAGELVRTGAKALGGGGGGKDDFAQGGGVDTSAVQNALKSIKDQILALK